MPYPVQFDEADQDKPVEDDAELLEMLAALYWFAKQEPPDEQ